MFHKLYKTILTEVCCLCDTQGLSGLDLCHECHKSLPHNHISCARCAVPVDRPTTDEQYRQLCGRCLSKPGDIDEAIIPFLYRPPVDFMIKRLKFSEENKFSRLLGELLSDAVERRYSDESGQDFPDVILPVPVHRQRLLERGFNQAEQIARTVSHRFGMMPDTHTVIRSTSKLPQSSLSAAQREANIRRAFEVRHPDNVQGLHVAIIDDVYTTGATARALSRRLKSAGASRISMWAVARTP